MPKNKQNKPTKQEAARFLNLLSRTDQLPKFLRHNKKNRRA